jgi:subfamily B ATP-binding cassette protein MsbA
MNSTQRDRPEAKVVDSRRLYMRLLACVRPYWKLFAVAIIGMVVTGLSEPAMPALIKPLLDNTFVDKDPEWIRLMPLLLIGLFVVRGIGQYAATVALAWVANKVVFDLRERMYAKVISLPASYHAGRNAGELISKLSYDVTQVTNAATNALLVAVRDGLAVVGLLGWMLWLDWQLALAFFMIAPVVALVVRVVARRLRRMSLYLQQSMGSMTHVLDETIRGRRMIKVYGGQEHQRRVFRDVANWIRSYSMKIVTTSAASVPVVQLILVSALAGVIYVTANTEMTVGSFVSFFGAAAMLLSPIKRLTALNEQIQRGLAAAQTIFELIDQPSEPDTGTRAVDRLRGEIEFQNVTLRYDDEAEPVVRNVSLHVAAGETVALVGASGAGKSSLVNMIPRFYLPSEGRILIDGIDINDMRLADLRANIAMVSQDVVLFNDTVAANIAYGAKSSAPREEIEAAARAAQVMEFAEQLSDGLDTPVGDDGVRLSGGQRQRLAIARALLKDAPILIMDEATSALDSKTERAVQTALENVRRGRTTLIIAHRLSTIESADRIVVMEQGRIVESGAHAELLGAGGAYARLYRAQFTQDGARNEESGPGSAQQ